MPRFRSKGDVVRSFYWPIRNCSCKSLFPDSYWSAFQTHAQDSTLEAADRSPFAGQIRVDALASP